MTAPKSDPYVRHAEVLEVVDGDTIHARVDLGCDVRVDMTLRLNGINAPEKGTPEGQAAKRWLMERMLRLPGPDREQPPQVVVQTFKDRKEKYGRYLAVLWDGTKNINDELVATGHAVPYAGGKR